MTPAGKLELVIAHPKQQCTPTAHSPLFDGHCMTVNCMALVGHVGHYCVIIAYLH